MNKQWSEINKQMQKEINSKATFKSGIETLFFLRNMLFQQLIDLRNNISSESFSKMPFSIKERACADIKKSLPPP